MILLARFLAENRRSLIVWCVAQAALCFMYLPFYPSIGGPELAELMARIPEPMLAAFGMGGPLDGVGYTHATIFGLIGTLFLILAAVSWGARAVAGDEESGALELTLSYPVARSQIVTWRALAITLQTAAVALVVTLSISVLSGPSQLGVQPANAFAAGLSFWLLGLLFGLAALAAGCVSGLRGAATGVGAGLAVAAYLAQTLGSQVSGLTWLARLSPFEWAYGHDPLRNGLSAGGPALLAGLSLLLVALAVWGLKRRDVGS